MTNIAFIDQTPIKTDNDRNIKPTTTTTTTTTATTPNNNRRPMQPEISPLHRSSFSHHPISLNEHEASRDGFEYDSRSSDEGGPDSERRSFHFRLEPKPAPPVITPFKLNSPSSGGGPMSPSSDNTVVSIASPYPGFAPSMQSPHPQRRVPPQPRTQPLPQHMLRSRKESLDLKHNTEPLRSQATTPRGLHPSQRQSNAQQQQQQQLQTPSHARLNVYQQTLQAQQQRQQRGPETTPSPMPSIRQRTAEQTPLSSMTYSPGDITDDDETREYSDENTTHHGLSRSEEGL